MKGLPTGWRSFGSPPMWGSLRTPALHRAGGFTLLELMVVVGIFAVLAVLAYGGLNSVLTARVAVEDSLERTVAMQKAYLRLRNDFQQLRERPARDGYGETQPPLLTTPDARVEFTRGGWRNPLSQPRSSQERVSYYLDEDERRLVRASWRVLDRAQDSIPVEVAVLENVEAAEWRFLDEARQWHSEWPALSAPQPPARSPQQAPARMLPLAVELKVRTRDWGELRFLFPR